MKNKLDNFLNSERMVHTWPAKRSNQLLVLDHMAASFPRGRMFTEREVNERLNTLHTWGDPCHMRRELVDAGRLKRTEDGASYWAEEIPESD